MRLNVWVKSKRVAVTATEPAVAPAVTVVEARPCESVAAAGEPTVTLPLATLKLT